MDAKRDNNYITTLLAVSNVDGVTPVPLYADPTTHRLLVSSTSEVTGDLGDLDDVTITSIASGDILKWNGSAWVNNTLAEAGIAASTHTHATTDITSGTFADARIAESNVTQHEGAIDHDALTNFVVNEHLDWTSDLGATNINDANITETAVTQHEGAIDHDQLTNFSVDEHFTQANITTVGTVTTGNVDAVVSDADATTKGKVELATSAETTTGTDATRAVTPDGLAGSDYGKRIMVMQVVESDTAVTTGDGKVGIPITSELNGWNIVNVQANVYTKGVTGTTDIQIRRQRGATDADVLSTKITIGDEYYATDETINTSNDDLATGDMLFVDIDAVHSGTAPNGLSVAIIAQLP